MKKLKGMIGRFQEYIYDAGVPMKDRAFMLFSATVLVALFLAIPSGLIMREPWFATVSTLVGALFFTLYVYFSFKRKTINRARVAISIILVFVFLPAMFFSNGGVYGGTPIWLLLGAIYIAMILEGRLKRVMLLMDVVVMALCWSVGYYHPELITAYTREGNYFDSIVGLYIVSGIIYTLISFQNNLYRTEEEQKNLRRLFEQTATALVNAIDAKDKYTHGHSARVAEYSKRIAEKAGMSPNDCNTIYYMALLHDVGKIGIPENIINKEGVLTEKEYNIVKQHPELGAQILQGISEFPYLAIGARLHHERYDGQGYPDHLKGTDIPEFARIISVADAYDAMTSKRSYRDPIPQQQVREEFVKGIGTQFDPKYARIMVHLIDMDIEYKMQEREEAKELSGETVLEMEDPRTLVSSGVLVNSFETCISLRFGPNRKYVGKEPKAAIILFDSLDAHYHSEEKEIRDLLYYEYGEIGLDGRCFTSGARGMQGKTLRNTEGASMAPDEYQIEGLRIGDHALIRIISKDSVSETIVALPDSSRFLYIGLTGEYCVLSNLNMTRSVVETGENAIQRIAPRVSHIEGAPVGDLPNVEIDGYRKESTPGIPVEDGLRITFHAQSLPVARLVWHCPFINLFGSDNGLVTGENYKDYTLMRLDGECWQGHDDCKIKLSVNHNDDFEDWETWKDCLKKGLDCTVSFEKKGNLITTRTENAGITIRNVSAITNMPETVYVALTGDQCSITNIRIERP